MPVTGGSSQPSLGRTSHCISNAGPKLWGRTMCHSLLNLLNAAWHKATEPTALTGSTLVFPPAGLISSPAVCPVSARPGASPSGSSCWRDGEAAGSLERARALGGKTGTDELRVSWTLMFGNFYEQKAEV